eukprot:g14302.t1
MSAQGYGRCLDAFIIALSQAYAYDGGGAGEGDVEGWFASTRELQLASLDLCRACRSVPSLLVRIDAGTPRRLWDTTPHCRFPTSTRSSRVPALEARSVRPWSIGGSRAYTPGSTGFGGCDTERSFFSTASSEPRYHCLRPRLSSPTWSYAGGADGLVLPLDAFEASSGEEGVASVAAARDECVATLFTAVVAMAAVILGGRDG